MTISRPRAVVRGGCCGHPEDCDDVDCRVRQRWAEAEYDREIEALNRGYAEPIDETDDEL